MYLCISNDMTTVNFKQNTHFPPPTALLPLFFPLYFPCISPLPPSSNPSNWPQKATSVIFERLKFKTCN